MPNVNWYEVALTIKDDLYDAWLKASVDTSLAYTKYLQGKFLKIWLFSNSRFSCQVGEMEIPECHIEGVEQLCFVSLPFKKWKEAFAEDHLTTKRGRYWFPLKNKYVTVNELCDLLQERVVRENKFEGLMENLKHAGTSNQSQ